MKRLFYALFAALISVLLVVPSSAVLADDVPEDQLTLLLPASDNAQDDGIMCVERFGGRHLEQYFSAVGSSPVYFSVVFTRTQTSWDSPNMVDGVPSSNSPGRFIFFSESPFVLYSYKKDLSVPSESGSSSYQSSVYGEESDSPFYFYSTLRLPDTFNYSGYFNQTAHAWYVFQTYPFNSLNDLRAWLSNPPAPKLSASFNVPAGYVAVFKASSGVSLSGHASFGFKSYPVNISLSAFGNTGQGYGYLDESPSGSLTFPTSSFTYFPWQKGEPRDAFGQSYNGTFSLNLNPSSGQFCYIYNPLYNPNAKDGPLNPTISVSLNGISNLHLYPLHNGVIDAGDGWGSSSDDGYQNPYIGNIDPDTGSVSYEDGSGNPVIPEYGGSNIVPDVDASQSLGEAVKSILKEIVSAITGIFSLAYQAIISLVGLAAPFFGKLAALYSWLPAPVLTALTSAMTLAVTIGVIRAFL